MKKHINMNDYKEGDLIWLTDDIYIKKGKGKTIHLCYINTSFIDKIKNWLLNRKDKKITIK